jgi:hypothetical protein
MNPTIEIDQYGCVHPAYVSSAKPGRYRLVRVDEIEELRRNFLLHLTDDRDRTLEMKVSTVRELFTAAGLGRKDGTE